MRKEELEMIFREGFELCVRFDKNLRLVKPILKSDICKEISNIIGVDVLLNEKGKNGVDALIEDGRIQECPLSVSVYNMKFETKVYINALPLKGKAKAMGLKSAFVKDNELILTSFKNENDSKVEKIIKDNDINQVINIKPETFNLKDVNDTKVDLTKNVNEASIDNPYLAQNTVKYRLDYLGKKSDLEKEYFGKTFNNNIHIQLIYNILDIKKILSLYIDDITYVLCNARRGTDLEDLMGALKYQFSWEGFTKKEKFNNYFEEAKSQLSYFANAFSERDNGERFKEEVFTTLRILSLCRQDVRHSLEKNASIFNLESYKNSKDDLPNLLKFLENKYDLAWNELNKSFIKNSKKNIYIIMQILKFPTDDKKVVEQVLNNYYELTIQKKNSNRGFDFKKLKEKVLERVGLELTPEQKSQATQAINYIISEKIDDDTAKQIVDMLRNKQYHTDKEKVYDLFADKIAARTRSFFNNQLIALIERIKKEDCPKEFSDLYDKAEFSVSRSESLFEKLVYFLCLFLSPKDSNMLLSSLINKFNNIAGFVSFIKEIYGCDTIQLTDEYKMFEDSAMYSNKLNIVNSLNRVQKQINKKAKDELNKAKDAEAKKKILSGENTLRDDVYYLFGFKECYPDLDIKDIYKEIKKQDDERKDKKITSFKKYITTSFVRSNKFRYIVEYANPADCCKIVKNSRIVKYVLNTIPNNQLLLYGEKVGMASKTKDEIVNYLTNKLAEINIEYLIKEYYKNVNRVSALAGLYFTVIYLVVKNIVRVNSYYSIGFSCHDRDMTLFGYNMESDETDYLALTKDFINRGKIKGHSKYCLEENLQECEKMFTNRKYIGYNNKERTFNPLRIYRDKVVHVNVAVAMRDYVCEFLKDDDIHPMRSYFELYNFVMQKLYIDEYLKGIKKVSEYIPQEIINYKNNLEIHQTYDKDFLHDLNMPLAYNLARYKNLTIEDIFYDDYKDKLRKKSR